MGTTGTSEAAVNDTDAGLEFLRAQARRDGTPLNALCELTHACNIDCEHCYLDLVSDKSIGALSTDEWKRVFRELADEGCIFLTLSGGELLVRRDWFELATHARGLGFALRLYTNGTMIDDAAADQMASLRPVAVEISILGATAETHDRVARKPKAFARTIAGVERLRARGIKVILKTVVMASNADEIDGIRALAARLGCQTYFDLEVTPKNNGATDPVALRTDAATVARLMTQESSRSVVHAEQAEQKRASREELAAAAPCSAGRTTCQIGPTGDLFPCTQWTKPVGNLRDKSFHAIWRGSDDLAKVRAKRLGDMTVCTSCPLFSVCSPCMALSQLERGNLDGASPTKCFGTWLRAAALGIPGRPAGLPADARLEDANAHADIPAPPETLVRLRVPNRDSSRATKARTNVG